MKPVPDRQTLYAAVVTSFVDLGDPKSSGVEAFTVREDLLVPLRRPEWKDERDTSLFAGEVYGRKATGSERMPMPTR